MRTDPPPFLAVLVRCPDGHHEVNTAQAFSTKERGNVARVCARCGSRLTLVKEAMIVPGRLLSETDCQCVLV